MSSAAATATPPPTPSGPGRPDAALVRALRARDEDAYLTLVRRYTPLMLRVARSHVASRAAAEDVVQDTWLAVLGHIDGFEARSSFKTWLMRILVNTARTRRSRDARSVCLGALPDEIGPWAETPRPGYRPPVAPDPEGYVLADEGWQRVERALATLPARQRTVVELRDVAGWSTDEVCHALGISPGNQRLLLHRGRTRLRELLAAARTARPTERRHPPGSQQPELAGPPHRVGPRRHVQLAEQQPAVGLDGVQRQVQDRADLALRQRPGQQRQQVPLPVAQGDRNESGPRPARTRSDSAPTFLPQRSLQRHQLRR